MTQFLTRDATLPFLEEGLADCGCGDGTPDVTPGIDPDSNPGPGVRRGGGLGGDFIVSNCPDFILVSLDNAAPYMEDASDVVVPDDTETCGGTFPNSIEAFDKVIVEDSGYYFQVTEVSYDSQFNLPQNFLDWTICPFVCDYDPETEVTTDSRVTINFRVLHALVLVDIVTVTVSWRSCGEETTQTFNIYINMSP